jgi:hypothetical protein
MLLSMSEAHFDQGNRLNSKMNVNVSLPLRFSFISCPSYSLIIIELFTLMNIIFYATDWCISYEQSCSKGHTVISKCIRQGGSGFKTYASLLLFPLSKFEPPFINLVLL